MAQPRPAANALTPQGLELLKIAHDGLRNVNEQLQGLKSEIYRLTAAKIIYYPSEPLSDRLEGHEHGNRDQRLFDNSSRELDEVSTTKAKLDSIQGTLRHGINELSRPYLRDLNVLDLPDELLLDIFELVEGFDPNPPFAYDHDSGREDIQNTRLVCRRFCDLSSQLLVRFVRVRFDEQSLSRLDEISRNPNIAKGVRAVQVVLHFYNSSFTDLELFTTYHADELENQVYMLDKERPPALSPLTQEQTESFMVQVVNGYDAVTKLHRLASAEPDDDGYFEDNSDVRPRLNELHKEYLILLEKQEWLIKSERFYEIVGSAIARMPHASRLELSDWDFRSAEGRGLITSEGDIWSALHRLALQPMTCYEANEHGFDLPSYQCAVSMIAAIRSAGTLLNKIDIKLSALGYPGSLVPTPDIRQELTSGMRQLKEFKFLYDGKFNEQDGEDLSEFLSACLGTSSLQKLSLDMRGHDGEAARIDLEKVMGSKSRKQLTDIFLGQISIDPFVLLRLLERLPEQMDRLSLSDVRLLSGTWEEALDALRKKECRIMRFQKSQGAECDTMSGKDYQRIFGENKHGSPNEAERYIGNLGSLKTNPLRAL
jgi:hypothetical protein